MHSNSVKDFNKRMDKVLQKVCDEDFLQSRKLGGEIPFYIFDYPPEYELEMRSGLKDILEKLPSRKPDLKFSAVNLFQFLVSYLEERELLEKSFKIQKKEEKAFKKLLRGF